jgi:tetratricopeptide (TPR) repeat protein
MDEAGKRREQGAALLRDGRVLGAVEALKAAVELDPMDVMAWRLYGGALAQAARPQEALVAFEEAARLQPEAAKNHYNVALTLLTLEQRKQAKERLEQALALDPSYEQARLRLAELGGGAASPPLPPRTPNVPNPPFVTLGGGTEATPPPPGGYVPPPGTYGGPHPSASSPVNGTTPLVVGILGIVLCQLLSPVAWVLGDNALKTLNAYPNFDQSQRGSALAGKILGIVGTVILILTFVVFVVSISMGALTNRS